MTTENTEQFKEYDDNNPSHALLQRGGWKRSDKKLGTGRADTMRSYSHPKHGVIEHHSNGSWDHFNYGKKIREGRSHSELHGYLHKELKAHQHSEEAAEGAEQFSENALHQVLTKHKYKHTLTDAKGHKLYEHKSKHGVWVTPKGDFDFRSHSNAFNYNNKKGKGAEALSAHLTKVHSSQHSEEQPDDTNQINVGVGQFTLGAPSVSPPIQFRKEV